MNTWIRFVGKIFRHVLKNHDRYIPAAFGGFLGWYLGSLMFVHGIFPRIGILFMIGVGIAFGLNDYRKIYRDLFMD